MIISSGFRHTSGLSPEYALLGFLEQAPAHGYELHQKLLDQLGEIWHTSLSQTYNILARLEEQGFIRGATQKQEKRPARRRFYLTAAGRRRFEAWLSSASACSVRAIRVEFVTRLYFLHSRDSEEARKAVEMQIQILQAQIARLKARLQEIGSDRIFNRMGMELRIRQLESLVESLVEWKTRIFQEG